MSATDTLFQQLEQIKVGVIGDVMLDTYWWGHVERISPEAPVPVVSLDKKEYRIGGAGNVALNTASLGARTHIISVVGNDEAAAILRRMFEAKGIGTAYMPGSDARITTSKTRIISRNQQMMRLDHEQTSDLTTTEEQQLLDAVSAFIAAEQPQVIILEDYNKGVLTENTIAAIIKICKASQVLVTVDPKRKNFFSYKGVDIFKPNLKEVKDGLNLLFDEVNESTMRYIHTELQRLLEHKISLITLSEHGVFYQQGDDAAVIPSHRRNIADVSGAGDTVIAVASLVYAATGNIPLMAAIANIAGGLVCEEVGTVAIDKERLRKEAGNLQLS
jgi:D-glycero-beta-D-manno-heptose-7-phosphate kinase